MGSFHEWRSSGGSQTGRRSISTDVDAASAWCGKQIAERESESVDLLVDPCSHLHLWPRALGSYWKNLIADTSGRIEPPPTGGLNRCSSPSKGTDFLNASKVRSYTSWLGNAIWLQVKPLDWPAQSFEMNWSYKPDVITQASLADLANALAAELKQIPGNTAWKAFIEEWRRVIAAVCVPKFWNEAFNYDIFFACSHNFLKAPHRSKLS